MVSPAVVQHALDESERSCVQCRSVGYVAEMVRVPRKVVVRGLDGRPREVEMVDDFCGDDCRREFESAA